MSDETTPAVKATAKSTPKPALASAAASSDPTVHTLMAHLQTAQMNGDEAEMAKLVAELAELGYE